MTANHKSEIGQRIDWQRFRTAMLICCCMLLLYILLIGGFAVLIGRDAVVCFQFMYFRGAVGIPSAIICAVSTVALLAAGIRGEFKIQLWGLTLEGPAAPITMWVVCFLAMCLALYGLFPEIGEVAKLPPVLAKLCS